MSDNNNVVADIVEMSKKPIEIVIRLHPNGNLEVSGPLNQPVTMLGILELAKDMTLNIQKKGREKSGNIVIPSIGGPKGPM